MLTILDEFAPLNDLCVCRGDSLPLYEEFASNHPEFETFRVLPWDKPKLLGQQQRFYDLMDRLGVTVHFIPPMPDLPWQMYTRDTAFVIGTTMYYATERSLPERKGEIDLVRHAFPEITDDAVVEITSGRIEGGDVMPDGDRIYVGMSTTRTQPEAIQELAARVDPSVEVVPLYLGPTVMHLDTRMTILPDRYLLICPSAFLKDDLEKLAQRFTFIEATNKETIAMGTNVFVPDPETVVVHAGFERIAKEIEAAGLKAERLDWSEPNSLLGSFRCATMPLARVG